MVRLLLLGCSALAGCQVLPIATVPPKPPQRIVLFEEVEADRAAIKQVVLRHLPAGTPIAQAQARLETLGFTCKVKRKQNNPFLCDDLIPNGVWVPPEMWKHLNSSRDRGLVYCQATLPFLQEWQARSCRTLVVLFPDETGALQDVEVALSIRQHGSAWFFQERPDLHEPVGLSVEQARARMEAAGFHCTWLEAKEADKDARAHLFCQAFAENPIGGQIVRVRLYPDTNGVIREVKVLESGELFDAERCMLPHGEPVHWAVCKTVLFPVRAGCRYALGGTVLLMALTAYPYGK